MWSSENKQFLNLAINFTKNRSLNVPEIIEKSQNITTLFRFMSSALMFFFVKRSMFEENPFEKLLLFPKPLKFYCDSNRASNKNICH